MLNIKVLGDVNFQTGQDIMDVLENKRGNVYPRLTRDVQDAIQRNADPSYTNSPALDMAIESASQWQHWDGQHLLDIMSTDYANYRQYGCGGLPITILVDITDAESDEMALHIVEEVDNVL